MAGPFQFVVAFLNFLAFSNCMFENMVNEDFIESKHFVFWPNATIPFYINPHHFDQQQSLSIMRWLTTFAFRTCIKFLPTLVAPEHNQHVMVFENPEGLRKCYIDNKGYSLDRPHTVILGYECLSSPNIEMIVMKNLGFPFEHNRQIRDVFITVQQENINPMALELFTKDTKLPAELRALPYDVNSVMHFDTRQFSNNGHRTIIFKDHKIVQERNGLSDIDLRKIEMVYGPECRNRDRLEQVEICQNHPGVARRKREVAETTSTIPLLPLNDPTVNLRVNRDITPPGSSPGDQAVTQTSPPASEHSPYSSPDAVNQEEVSASLRDLGIEDVVEDIVEQVHKVTALALKNARLKYCNNTQLSLRSGVGVVKSNVSDILSIVENIADYSKAMVLKATANLTEFCESSKSIEAYQRGVSCPFLNIELCRKSYRSTKSGAVMYSTQHRPLIRQSTKNWDPVMKKKRDSWLRSGNDTISGLCLIPLKPPPPKPSLTVLCKSYESYKRILLGTVMYSTQHRPLIRQSTKNWDPVMKKKRDNWLRSGNDTTSEAPVAQAAESETAASKGALRMATQHPGALRMATQLPRNDMHISNIKKRGKRETFRRKRDVDKTVTEATVASEDKVAEIEDKVAEIDKNEDKVVKSDKVSSNDDKVAPSEIKILRSDAKVVSSEIKVPDDVKVGEEKTEDIPSADKVDASAPKDPIRTKETSPVVSVAKDVVNTAKDAVGKVYEAINQEINGASLNVAANELRLNRRNNGRKMYSSTPPNGSQLLPAPNGSRRQAQDMSFDESSPPWPASPPLEAQKGVRRQDMDYDSDYDTRPKRGNKRKPRKPPQKEEEEEQEEEERPAKKVRKPKKQEKVENEEDDAENGENEQENAADDGYDTDKTKRPKPRTVKLSMKNKEFYGDRRWPSGIVPFLIANEPEYSKDDIRERIEEVNMILKKETCASLEELTEDQATHYQDYLVLDTSPDFVTGHVGGRQNFGVLELFKGGQHRQHGAMMVMAMLGFYFEVARHDRDKYIRVHNRHIRADKLHHFEKIREDATFPLPYDYKSAMHPAWQFWREIGRSGISTVATYKEQDPGGELMKSLGQNEELLSELDLVKINSVYGTRCFRPKAKPKKKVSKKDDNEEK